MARKARKSDAITPVEYSGLQAAYDHFNKELFGGKLPDVFITYQRKARSLGYFSADRFNGRLDKTGRHELALNPDGFINESDMARAHGALSDLGRCSPHTPSFVSETR